jgi:hypothetical protein
MEECAPAPHGKRELPRRFSPAKASRGNRACLSREAAGHWPRMSQENLEIVRAIYDAKIAVSRLV